MKHVRKLSLLSLIALLSACQQGSQTVMHLDKISFSKCDIVQKSFGGLGVEWGTYENTDKLRLDGWETALRHMDKLAPARIRLMVSYDWFCYNYDNKGTEDKNDDTWSYNFTNKWAKNTFEILEYCQVHDIDVAFGAWNVIADLSGDDEWGMMDEVSSDIRWAKISADVLDLLINKKGYSCIKWFVNTNEPNWTGSEGSSKNYNNTYEKWEQGVKNVRKALDEVGCKNVGIIGGDTTGLAGSQEYLLNIAKNIPTLVADYGCHMYLSNFEVDRGGLYTVVKDLYNQIKEIDKGAGKTRLANVWEAGLVDGKTSLDSQSLINMTSYAVRMIDYTIQCLAVGINGICYWDFDDGMHFMYTENAVVPKQWGMFSSLAESTSQMQELRPWYHSSMLLTHLFKKGNIIYSPKQNDPEILNSFRSLATISPDKKQGGYVLVNAGREDVKKSFILTDEVEGDTLYIYRFKEGEYLLGEDGYIIPNSVIQGSLNKSLTFDVPKSSAIIVSNTRL